MATYDPFRDLDRIASGLFDTRRGPRRMPMDLYRDGDHYVLSADLPGIDPGSVDIDVDGQLLTIRAERPAHNGDVEWLAHERPSGTFARQLTLGYGVALDRITAEYTDGVLTLTIPVAEEAKPRKIQVTHAAGTTHPVIEADGAPEQA